MARVLYLGPPAAVRQPKGASVADLMLATGRNTGNMLIGDAIGRHLNAGTFCTAESLLRLKGEPLTTPRLAPLEKLDTEFIEASFDVIVIGAANFLCEQFDFGNWAAFLDSVRLPCVIIGLGAQAPDYGHRVTVPEGTDRLVRIIAERSTSLGVRGAFTADTLERMGIANVRPIGCPSMYWTCQSTLTFKPPAAGTPLAVCTNGSANVTDHSSDPNAARRVEAMISRLSFAHGYAYILQNETELMEILENDPMGSDDAPIRVLMNRHGLSEIPPEAFIRYVRQSMKVFSDPREWFAAVERVDFVLGTRFHGCLIGLLVGVPCFAFVHDARTREMSELLQIPSMDVRRVREIDARVLHDNLNLDLLKTTYSRQYRNYVEFLDENDLDHCLKYW
jgi:hypothetical protein